MGPAVALAVQVVEALQFLEALVVVELDLLLGGVLHAGDGNWTAHEACGSGRRSVRDEE